MISRGILYLGALLGLQLLVAVAMSLSSDDYGAFEASEPFLEVNSSAVQSVEITAGAEGGGASTTLARSGDGWVVSALGDFPADGDRVERLVEKLAALKRGWPAAETAGGAERLRVTADDFERRITLSGESGALATALLGASPSFRQVYARREDETVVYTVGFETSEAPAEAASWIQRDVLRLDAADVSEIVIGSITLVKSEASAEDGAATSFAVADLAEGETPDGVAVQGLAAVALGRAYDSVGAPAEAEALDISAPLVEAAVRTAAGETVVTRYVGDPTDEARILFTTSDQPHLFRVSRSRIERLLVATREGLMTAAAEAAPAEEAPTEEAPTEETPAQETPAEETPADEAPAEPAPAGEDDEPLGAQQ